jgi:hypothetical protein
MQQVYNKGTNTRLYGAFPFQAGLKYGFSARKQDIPDTKKVDNYVPKRCKTEGPKIWNRLLR